MHTLICTHTYIHTLCGYTVYMQTVYVETLPQSLIYLLIHTFVPKNTFTYLYPAHTYTYRLCTHTVCYTLHTLTHIHALI